MHSKNPIFYAPHHPLGNKYTDGMTMCDICQSFIWSLFIRTNMYYLDIFIRGANCGVGMQCRKVIKKLFPLSEKFVPNGGRLVLANVWLKKLK